ncbi:MAG: hypothetical protein NVSMB48_16600 [Marmoricola sp.]
MMPTIDAFMAFYDATCDAAYRLACCLTGGDQRAAEDAVTRAYVRAYGSGLHPRHHGHALILGLVRDELPHAVAQLRAQRRPQLSPLPQLEAS